jgi:hypothetical protein
MADPGFEVGWMARCLSELQGRTGEITKVWYCDVCPAQGFNG